MNFRYLILLLLLSCNQGPIEDMNEQVEIFRIVETMPTLSTCTMGSSKERRGCTSDSLKSFFTENMQYPELARQNNYQDTVVIQFVVERDGSIMEIKLIRDKKYGLGKEGLRLANLMKDELEWTSGKQREKPVRVRLTLPIVFKL